MAAGPTYEPIATTTVSTATGTITFSSIPSTYTDLRIVVSNVQITAANTEYLRFNNDATTKYSSNVLRSGSPPSRDGSTGSDAMRLTWGGGFPQTGAQFYSFIEIDVISYSATNKFKGVITTYNNDQNGSGDTGLCGSLYRSTSAINRVDLITNDTVNTKWEVGTVVSLYGITKA